MGTITAIRDSGRGKRAKVFLDGKFAFSLDTEVVVKERLQVGQGLPDSRIDALNESDRFHRSLEAALRYLSYRPRSEHEVRESLRRRGFGADSVDEVMARLKEQGLVDDAAFARFWKDNREAFSPRSQSLTRLELRQKRVADTIIDRVVDTVDDDESAYKAARDKVQRIPVSDYETFRRRLGGYLKRRGFGYGVISKTVGRMWQELAGDNGNNSLPEKQADG